jgi:competence protein ComEA
MRQFAAWAVGNLRVLVAVCFALSAIAFTMAWLQPGASAEGSDAPLLQEPVDTLADANLAITPRSTDTPSAPGRVIVYISGAVKAPDVYELPADARVKDLVLAAGGLAQDADTERINLAERLKDSAHVHVPRQGEAIDDAATAADTSATASGGPLDLNTASASDLDGLPGIGQSIAERIIEYRTSNGAFTSVEDLQKVKGIGAALFAKIAPLVSVGP